MASPPTHPQSVALANTSNPVGDKRTAEDKFDATADESKRPRLDGETERQQKNDDEEKQLRAWAADGESPGPIYTLRCAYGDPDDPLPSFMKSRKVAWIKSQLEMRGLDTSGTKAVLLDRLRREVPSVTIKIDGRECLQRVVNAMLHSYGWDNSHLFSAKFPARGPIKKGRGDASSACGIDRLILFRFGDWWREFGLDTTPYDWPPQDSEYIWPRMLRHWDRCRGRLTWEQVRDIALDPNAPGPIRKLTGSAFDPLSAGFGSFSDESSDTGVRYSLQELELKKGDTIRIKYDFGDNHRFKLVIEDVGPDAVLEEKDLYSNPTRFEFVTKGKCRLPPQYQGEMY